MEIYVQKTCYQNDIDLPTMREAGRIAANVLKRVSAQISPGVATLELDEYARSLLQEYGAQSACYGYRMKNLVFPAHICVSINDEVVHGIPSPHRFLKEGDLVSLDVCIIYEGHVADNAATFGVGNIAPKYQRLLKVAESALYNGVAKALPMGRVGDISSSIQKTVEKEGFSLVREFVGHGVGRELHQEPQIPNCGLSKGKGHKLYPGMTLAIEPMVNFGVPNITYKSDGWTVATLDRKPSAHFEHTILLTESHPEILTLPSV
jgi:methionyl aminopeptidase